MKALFISLFIIVLLGIAVYFVYGIFCIYRLNAKQKAMGTDLPDHFKEPFLMQRDLNGYFCIDGRLEGSTCDNFILDTKATRMSRIEKLEDVGANYWESYPMPVKNVYGQQEKLPLYEIPGLVVHNRELCKPLFKGIRKTNALYELLYKDVLGKDVLKNFSWKFSLDDGLVTLFSNKDSEMLKSESPGFVKINDGLKRDISLDFPITNCHGKFGLDLGCQGCINIDEELFDKLKLKSPYEKYLNERIEGRIDTAFVFNDIDIKFADMLISNCTLCYYPLVNRSLIGVRLIERLNFILGYHFMDNSSVLKEDLYVQKRRSYDIKKMGHMS